MKADRLMVLLCGLIIVATSLVLAETTPSNLKHGQSLYQLHCLRCHGATLDGKGPEAASLSVRPTDFHKYLSGSINILELEITIRQGRKLKAMHQWDTIITEEQVSNLLTDEDVYDLVAYIRSAIPNVEVNP